MEAAHDYTFTTDSIDYTHVQTKSGSEFYITGYISTDGLDIQNELITKNGLSRILDQIKDKDISADFDHDTLRTTNNNLVAVGRIVDAKLEGGKLWAKVMLNPEWKRFDPKGNVTMTFENLWESIKGGFVTAFSVAFKPLKVIKEVVQGVKATLIDDLIVLNVALTGRPVNPEAVITGFSMKSALAQAAKDITLQEDKTMDEPKKDEPKAEEKKSEPAIPQEEAEVECKNCHKKYKSSLANCPFCTVEKKAEEQAKPEEDKPKEEVKAKSIEEGKYEKLELELKSLQNKIVEQAKTIDELKNAPVFKSLTPAPAPTLKAEDSGPKNVLGFIR